MLIASAIPHIGSALVFVIRVVFLGNCFVRLYAMTEHTSEQQQLVIGYISGVFPIVAVVKFLLLKHNNTKTM
jgi:nitrate reductase gamma subunit